MFEERSGAMLRAAGKPAISAGSGSADPGGGEETAGTGRRARRLALVAVSAQTVIAACTFLIAKGTLTAIPPLALATLRTAGSAVLMALVLRFRPKGTRAIPRSAWLPLAILGVIGVAVNQSAFLAGLARSTPTHAALLYALTPACVHLIARLRGEEAWSRRRAAGIGLALAGAAAIVGVRAPGGAHADTRAGDLLIALGVIAWAIYTAEAPRYVRAVGAIRFTAVTLIAGAVAALPFGVLPLSALDLARIPTGAWLGLGFLIVFTSALAYACWTIAMKGLTASQVAVFVNFQPVLTALLSIFFFGEKLTGALVLGGALVCVGIALTQSGAEAPADARASHGA
jgi:drug/metabolite transporter (DMT)-like permease